MKTWQLQWTEELSSAKLMDTSKNKMVCNVKVSKKADFGIDPVADTNTFY